MSSRLRVGGGTNSGGKEQLCTGARGSNLVEGGSNVTYVAGQWAGAVVP